MFELPELKAFGVTFNRKEQGRKAVSLQNESYHVMISDKVETRLPEQKAYEEEIRSLFDQDITAEDFSLQLKSVCEKGKLLLDTKIEKAEGDFPEEDNRLMADIREDYARAEINFSGEGNFPRQTARIVEQISEIAGNQIDEEFRSLVWDHISVNHETGKRSKIKFKFLSKEKRNFEEKAFENREKKLKRIAELKTMVEEKYPQTKEYFEEKK